VTWDLLGQFKCEMPFKPENWYQISKVPKQLVRKDKIFQFKVLPESADLQVEMKMNNDF